MPGLLACMCDSYDFIRFENGKVLWVSEYHTPPEWLGKYEKTGWGEYKVTFFGKDASFVTKPGILLFRPYIPFGISYRDLMFVKCSRILKDPQQAWIHDSNSLNILTRTFDGTTKYYANTKDEISLAKLETNLMRLKERKRLGKNPLIIYVEDTGITDDLRAALSRLQIEYIIRPNKVLRLFADHVGEKSD